ncbi:MAG TPA: sigma factor-like helix-turn-helix DNA-binding protein [Bryobacteraceae bacterium]|jgi:RNA polymerase sigma factor (sigma-70 family)|nr:sigma factor-like helix-turn-helix DNA-binding protein [Bryobacteraceae bacterium]
MTSRTGPPLERDPASDYRRLVSVLASRAARFGSRDPEGAAQEALRRSLENPKSRHAVEYYLGEESPAASPAPEWPLDRLLAWLHGVLQFVVREEQSRVGFRREISGAPVFDPADSAPDTLDALVARETRDIVWACFAGIDREYRQVLELRMDGWKYGEIARRLGVNENTVATWVSRGTRELGRRIRTRMGGDHD